MSSQYTALDKGQKTIRVLHLSPDPHPDDNRIQCTLEIVDLADAPVYEALSYTWGEPDDFSLRIWIDDTHVSVRYNLLSALKVLRAIGYRVLWIDALCINQEDVEERNHQVMMMRDIYSKAEQVLSWLGSPGGIECFPQLVDTLTSAPSNVPVSGFDLLETAMEIESCGDEDRISAWWERMTDDYGLEFMGLEEICCLKYWNRLWIVQEVCLAKRLKLIYGMRIVSWDAFLLFKDRMERMEVFDPWSSVSGTRPWMLADLVKYDTILDTAANRLINLIRGTSNCECQDRRDKIYGLLGLVADAHKTIISVDYSRPLSAVYHTVLSFIEQYQALVNIAEISYLLQTSLLASGPSYKDYNDLLSDRDTSQHSPRLREQEIEIIVTDLGKVQRIMFNAKDRMEARADSQSTTSATDWQTTIRDSVIASRKRKWPDIIAMFWKADHDLLKSFWKPPTPTSFTKDGTNSSPSDESEPGLVIFTSEERFVGLASTAVLPGDILCQCHAPLSFYILRRVQDENVLVGRAVVAECTAADWDAEDANGLCEPPTFDPTFFPRSHIPYPEYQISFKVLREDLQRMTCPLRAFEIKKAQWPWLTTNGSG